MYHFFVNPYASSGRGKQVWRKVKHILDTDMIPYEVHMLKSAEDAIWLASQLSEPLGEDLSGKDINHIVVLGGDGSLNTVLQGINDFSRVRLSVLQTGSGNDFAKDMEIEKNTESALLSLLYMPEEISMDYGDMTAVTENGEEYHRRFLISSGIGYDANICEKANRSHLKKMLNRFGLGKLVYILLGVKEILTRTYCQATITMKDAATGTSSHMTIPKLFFIVGMIHEYEGGGLPFCPDADYSDGLFDICLVEGMSTPKVSLAILLAYLKKHFLIKKIHHHRCSEFSITLSEPQWIHTDGEVSHQVKEVHMMCRSGLHFIK